MKQLGIFGDNQQHQHKNSTKKSHFTLHVDGASRNNPGPSGAGIYLLQDKRVIAEAGYFLGIRTNNQAEYFALLLGIITAQAHMKPNDHITIISDSQLLIRQMSGAYRVRHDGIKPLHHVAQRLLNGIRYELRHVVRELNQEADACANKGIDERIAVPQSMQDSLIRHGVSL